MKHALLLDYLYKKQQHMLIPMQSVRGKREKGRGEKDCEPVKTKRGCKKCHRGEKKGRTREGTIGPWL